MLMTTKKMFKREEHRPDINKKNGFLLISYHRIQKSHEFDWKNVQILENRRTLQDSFLK